MLKTDQAVLVVIDIQGRLATLMYEKESFFANAGRMISGAQILGLPVIWNEQLPDKLGDTIPQIKQLLPEEQSLVKKTFSCCGHEPFIRRLAELRRRQVILIGMETHVCVYQSALDLLAAGYEVHVPVDAVSSRTVENKTVALEAMRQSGAHLTSVEMALFEMLRVAEGELFKKIIALVK